MSNPYNDWDNPDPYEQHERDFQRAEAIARFVPPTDEQVERELERCNLQSRGRGYEMKAFMFYVKEFYSGIGVAGVVQADTEDQAWEAFVAACGNADRYRKPLNRDDFNCEQVEFKVGSLILAQDYHGPALVHKEYPKLQSETTDDTVPTA